MGQVTPEHVQGILINPFYAIQVASNLVESHEPSMRDEEWITGNSSFIEKIGAEQWLLSLLDVLQGNTSHELVNPYHAINIDPMFALEHPPVWPKEQWLRLLLDVLEGDFVTANDMRLAAPPTTDRTRYRFSQRKGKKRKKHKK